MLGWIDLKAGMAACWYGSWNFDPLALSVPESLAVPPPLPDEELLPEELLPEGLLDELELQAARDKAIATRVTPAVVTPLTRTRCILDTPLLLPAKRGNMCYSLFCQVLPRRTP